jgi:chromatin remodeling complex protein RSC6
MVTETSCHNFLRPTGTLPSPSPAMTTAFCCSVGLRTAHSPALRALSSRSPLVTRTAPFASVAASASAAPRKMPAVVRPMVPSVALCAFVVDCAQPRSHVLKALSAYAKDNGLQDPKDKTMVLCDARLKALLGVDSCSFLAMSKYVSPHLSKPEDVGGKYIAEAKAFEVQWLTANPAKAAKKPMDNAGKRASASADAKSKGTGLWAPVKLSPELTVVCGGKASMPRQQIIKAIWEYIRANKLQDKAGAPIKCDSAMKSVFKTDSVTAKVIMSSIQPHIQKLT